MLEYKIQQQKSHKKLRTTVDFSFERANILSKKPARKIGSKLKEDVQFCITEF